MPTEGIRIHGGVRGWGVEAWTGVEMDPRLSPGMCLELSAELCGFGGATEVPEV